MSDYVHIVTFEAPSPPDYGGAIDIYYKIIALSEIGKKVILHYFNHKEKRSTEGLEKYCHKIYTYKRALGLRSFSLRVPYIVQSRINKELVERLNQDSYPIILEGIHSTGVMRYLNNNRQVVIRLHNNETKYYKSLANSEINPFKKLYFLLESTLLKGYQNSLPKNTSIACVSRSDLKDFQILGFTNLHFVPILIPWQKITSQIGTGIYCLYHGNMKISENEQAAIWLIDNVFSKCTFPFIIAGKEVSNRVVKKIAQFKHIKFVSSPSEERMKELIKNAQINILPSTNNTGVKLKLVNALFNGRYCITNQAGIDGTNIDSGVFITDNGKEIIEIIKHIFTIAFSEKDIEQRKALLQLYDNYTNVRKLNALIS